MYNSIGTKSYSWDIGYGWNVPAGNYILSTGEFTLIPTSYPPGNVSVTPSLNGISYPKKTSTISLAPFQSAATILGISSFCTYPTSSTFTIDAGAGNTVAWSTSNSGIATISSQTNSQVTVTALSPGFFVLYGLITNSCGQPSIYPISKSITVGSATVLIDGYTCVTESAPCFLNATASNNYLAFSLSAPTGTYTPLDSDWQWEKISGNFYFLENGQYNSPTHTGKQCNIYITGVNPTDAPMQFRCRVRNSCDWGEWRTYTWNDGTTTPVVPPTPPANYFKVAPNPTGGYAANISLLNSSILPPTTSPIIARLYSIYGQLLSTTQLNNNSGQVYVYSFPYTTMYLTIIFDSHTEYITVAK